MKNWLVEKVVAAGSRLWAAAESGGRALGWSPGRPEPVRGTGPAVPGSCDPAALERHMGDESEFTDLLAALGSTQGPSETAAELRLRELEVAELKHNLQSLRGMGDGLAELERRHLAERAELERECSQAREDARLWRAQAEDLEAQLAARGESAPADRPASDSPQQARLAAELEALEQRYKALGTRHRKLAARWRALPADERAAGTELGEKRAELARERRRAASLETRIARQERELARLETARIRDRERLAREKERAAAARERAREHRERSLARGAELRELKDLLRQRDERLGELSARWEALGGELGSLSETLDDSSRPTAASLLGRTERT